MQIWEASGTERPNRINILRILKHVTWKRRKKGEKKKSNSITKTKKVAAHLILMQGRDHDE